MAEELLDGLRKSCKTTALQVHQDKSDEDLRKIINQNAFNAQLTNDQIELTRLCGEIDGCKEILEWRKNEGKQKEDEAYAIKKAQRDWPSTVAHRRKKAILNLPVATSYYGQLVAAILDDAEHSLSATEIRQWSDELVAMNDSEYKKLLDDLCSEEILYRTNDDMYAILSLCTPDLFPTNPQLWMQVHGPHANYYTDSKFLQYLLETGRPATELDWIDLQPNAAHLYTPAPGKISPRTWKDSYKNIRNSYLNTYLRDRVLSATPIPGTDLNYYYFVMLGEKEGE